MTVNGVEASDAQPASDEFPLGHYPEAERRGATSIVALCGSRSAESVSQAEADLSLAGKIVLAPFVLAHLSRSTIGQRERAVLDGLHRAKIDIADEVVVVNPDGYLTEATFDEIGFTLGLGKPVSFTEPVVAMQLQPERFDAMLSGAKTVEVRKRDFKGSQLRPTNVVRFEAADGRRLLARVLTISNSPNPAALLGSVDPDAVVPGADRDQLAAFLEERYPGILGSSTPMIAITVSVLGQEHRPPSPRTRRLPAGCTITWSDFLPAGIPVTGAAGWLVDPFDGRVLMRFGPDEDPDHRFGLPGGRIEPGDGGDLTATLVREAFEESQVEVDPRSAVLLGYHIVSGYQGRPGPHAKARFLAPITLYEPIGPDPADARGRTFRRFMTTVDRAVDLLGWGEAGQHEGTAVRAAARALGLPVDDPAPEGFRDDGDSCDQTPQQNGMPS